MVAVSYIIINIVNYKYIFKIGVPAQNDAMKNMNLPKYLEASKR